jgi:hypothetical protein
LVLTGCDGFAEFEIGAFLETGLLLLLPGSVAAATAPAASTASTRPTSNE